MSTEQTIEIPAPPARATEDGRNRGATVGVGSNNQSTDDLLSRVAVAICEEALAPKLCTCQESGRFACADEIPGRMASQAIAVVRQWDAGK